MSEVINANLQMWRTKCADGTISVEEMREAIAAIRKERVTASEVSGASRTRKTAEKKSKTTPVDSAALLGELGI